MDERWQEVKAIWKQNQWLYVLAGFALGVLFFPMLGALAEDAGAFLQSLVPEAIGIVFTVLLIDRIYQRREAKREEGELKAQLIREMGSTDNGIALRAVKELMARDWLFDGSVQNASFANADLRNATLNNADLSKSDFSNTDLRYIKLVDANLQNSWMLGASLTGANLNRTNLQKVELSRVDLRRAFLREAQLQDAVLNASDLTLANLQVANLQNASLTNVIAQGTMMATARLQGASLVGANCENAEFAHAYLENARLVGGNFQKAGFYLADLRKTDLRWANFSKAYLVDADFADAMNIDKAIFDITTTLPDGTKWTPDTDMSRFTDPAHPQFWRSDNPSSPAYEGVVK